MPSKILFRLKRTIITNILFWSEESSKLKRNEGKFREKRTGRQDDLKPLSKRVTSKTEGTGSGLFLFRSNKRKLLSLSNQYSSEPICKWIVDCPVRRNLSINRFDYVAAFSLSIHRINIRLHKEVNDDEGERNTDAWERRKRAENLGPF